MIKLQTFTLMQDFSLSIRIWFRQNARSLPWRDTKNPYFIWLSEIILQQTRVEQGRSYYEKFIKHFPTIKDLAEADEQQVLNLWQGLGYYSRARNLHFAAKQVVDEFGGAFPSTFEEIRSLKGVGDYTASAIASFAYELPHAVVDGNVYRVLSRYYGDDTPIDSTQGKKLFAAYAEQLLDPDHAGDHNQAIMEIGALICKPKNPSCSDCPVSESCQAFRNANPLDYPVKAKKTKVTNRYFNYLVAGNKEFQLQKRVGKGIWQNMFEFPLYESEKALTKKTLAELVNSKYGVSIEAKIVEYTHVLSHQKIHASFWLVSGIIQTNDQLIRVNIDEVDDYPLPRLIHRFIEEYNPEYNG